MWPYDARLIGDCRYVSLDDLGVVGCIEGDDSAYADICRNWFVAGPIWMDERILRVRFI